MGDMWMFYADELAAAGVNDMPPSVGRCPTDGGTVVGQHYEQHSYLSPLNVTWVWHPPKVREEHVEPYAAFEPNSWVEVIHMGGIDDEHVGAWFLQARGSGIWFHLGKTIVFDDHAEGHMHFDALSTENGSASIGARNEVMCANASLAGYDSIQFVRHTCNMMYGQCRNASLPGLNYFNIEIVSTKLVGFHPCATSSGTSPLIRSGWKGGRACTCNTSSSIDFLNCKEVVPSGQMKKQQDHWHMMTAKMRSDSGTRKTGMGM